MKRDLEKYDLTLVTTYLPIFGLCVRSCVFTTIYFVCMHTIFLPHDITLAIVVVLVYMDGWYAQNLFFDKHCGYLIPIALHLIIQTNTHCNVESVNLMQLVSDSLWSLLCVFQIIITLFNMPVEMPLMAKIILNGICFVLHVVVECQELTFFENIIRGCLFYICNAMLILFLPFFDNVDKHHNSNYHVSCLHKTFHLLFIHNYTLICSCFVIVAIHVYFVYQRAKTKSNNHQSNQVHQINQVHQNNQSHQVVSDVKQLSRNNFKPDSSVSSDDNTLQCLREAKRLHGIP